MSSKKKLQLRKAFILVGGFGTRLKSKFPNTPKPLVPVAGKPFLEHLLEKLENDLKIEEIILLTGFRYEDFVSFVAKRKNNLCRIHVSQESKPLGSAGALKHAAQFWAEDKHALVINGDTFFDGNLEELQNLSLKPEASLLATNYVREASRYGLLELAEPLTSKGISRIIKFKEKSSGESGWVNSGIFILSAEILQQIPDSKFYSLEVDILPKLPELSAIKISGHFYDIGLTESHSELNFCLLVKSSQFEWTPVILASLTNGGRIYLDLQQSPITEPNQNFLSSNGPIRWLDRPPEYLSFDDVLVSDQPQTLQQVKRATKMAVGLTSHFDYDFTISNTALNKILTEWSELAPLVEPGNGANFKLFSDKRPAIFLDRDGVLINHVHYISKPKDVKLKLGVPDLLKKARKAGFFSVMISNQAGIGKGNLSWSEHQDVQLKMRELLAAQGAALDACYESPFYSGAKTLLSLSRPQFRKPQPGMLLLAAQELGIDLSRSFFIGDRESDLIAAVHAGVMHLVYLKNSLYPEWHAFEKWILSQPQASRVQYQLIEDLNNLNI